MAWHMSKTSIRSQSKMHTSLVVALSKLSRQGMAWLWDKHYHSHFTKKTPAPTPGGIKWHLSPNWELCGRQHVWDIPLVSLVLVEYLTPYFLTQDINVRIWCEYKSDRVLDKYPPNKRRRFKAYKLRGHTWTQCQPDFQVYIPSNTTIAIWGSRPKVQYREVARFNALECGPELSYCSPNASSLRLASNEGQVGVRGRSGNLQAAATTPVHGSLFLI